MSDFALSGCDFRIDLWIMVWWYVINVLAESDGGVAEALVGYLTAWGFSFVWSLKKKRFINSLQLIVTYLWLNFIQSRLKHLLVYPADHWVNIWYQRFPIVLIEVLINTIKQTVRFDPQQFHIDLSVLERPTFLARHIETTVFQNLRHLHQDVLARLVWLLTNR